MTESDPARRARIEVRNALFLAVSLSLNAILILHVVFMTWIILKWKKSPYLKQRLAEQRKQFIWDFCLVMLIFLGINLNIMYYFGMI